MIIPSIDLMGGKAVQLKQGKEKVLEREDVFDLAREFSLYGEIAVVDLDAALGKGDNKDLIKALCRQHECRVGGGVRTVDLAREYLKAGAAKVIIGTKATPEFLEKLSPANVVVAVDEKAGSVTTQGWTTSTGEKVVDKIRALEAYCSEFLYTQVDSEGMLKGINLDNVKRVRSATHRALTAAGGITTAEDVKALAKTGVNAQIGMAIYTGRMKLDELFAALLHFDGGLIPTIAQDEAGQVVMLAHSSPESVRAALREKRGVYYSRSRREIWRKGETSGHVQELSRVAFDCDLDALVFTVRQTGNSCHLPQYSCFGGKKRDAVAELFAKLREKKRDWTGESFTQKLFREPELIKEKILEEAKELTEASKREDLVWEAADVLFFTYAWMVQNDVSLEDVENELRARQKK